MLKSALLFSALTTLLISVSPAFAAGWEVYGYAAGARGAQPLTQSQMSSLSKTLHGTPSWYVIVSGLNKSNPKVHIIDQDHFKGLQSKYGTHQAYATYMGFSTSDADYIKRLKGPKREFMPFILYVRANGTWVLQNRRYNFTDNSKQFAASLAKAEGAFANGLSGLVSGNAAFVTYEDADPKHSHYRPNTMTSKGQADIAALQALGFDLVTEDGI